MGCRIAPCPSTQSRSPCWPPSTTSRSAAPARKSDTTASTAIPHPAMAIPVCPVGTKTDRRPRFRASRSSSQVAVIFPIAESEPTVRTIVASTSRLSQVAELDAVPRGELRQAGNVVQADVQPVLEVEAFRDAVLQQLLPVAGEVAALRDNSDERGVWVEAEGVVDGANDRHAVIGCPGALRVEDRHDGLAPVAHDAAQGLAVVRIVREPLSEDEVPLV